MYYWKQNESVFNYWTSVVFKRGKIARNNYVYYNKGVKASNNNQNIKIEVFNTSPIKKGIGLKYCGTEICEPGFSMEPHIRQEYLIHCVLSGSGTFTSNNKTYELKPGSLFIIYPDTLVSYKNNEWDPFHFSWFSFSGNNSEEIIDELGFNKEKCVVNSNAVKEIHGVIEECIKILDEKIKVDHFKLESFLFELFSLISNDINKEINYICRVQEEHVEKAASYIKMNYMHPINVLDVVSFTSLERTYLSKIFKQYKKESIRDYISNTRVEQAKKLLEKTNLSSKQISSYVGFKDECYFSRVFKKTTSLTPQEYRDLSFKKKEEENV